MGFPWDSQGIHSDRLRAATKNRMLLDQLEVLGMNQTPTEQLVALEADSVLVDDALSHVQHFDSF